MRFVVLHKGRNEVGPATSHLGEIPATSLPKATSTTLFRLGLFLSKFIERPTRLLAGVGMRPNGKTLASTEATWRRHTPIAARPPPFCLWPVGVCDISPQSIGKMLCRPASRNRHLGSSSLQVGVTKLVDQSEGGEPAPCNRAGPRSQFTPGGAPNQSLTRKSRSASTATGSLPWDKDETRQDRFERRRAAPARGEGADVLGPQMFGT